MSVLARYPVAKNVVILHNDVALVNPYAELDPGCVGRTGIALGHPVLPLGRTPKGIDHTGKFDQQPITGRFDNTATVFGDLRVDNLRPDRPEPVEGAFFVHPDQPRIARHIGGEDRGKAASLAHVPSSIAKRRPDSKRSRCSGFRK
jgi:hypothetical protein